MSVFSVRNEKEKTSDRAVLVKMEEAHQMPLKLVDKCGTFSDSLEKLFSLLLI